MNILNHLLEGASFDNGNAGDEYHHIVVGVVAVVDADTIVTPTGLNVKSVRFIDYHVPPLYCCSPYYCHRELKLASDYVTAIFFYYRCRRDHHYHTIWPTIFLVTHHIYGP